MALYGYARVSSSDQNFALQEQALRAAGCDVVRAEKASGTSSKLNCVSSSTPVATPRSWPSCQENIQCAALG